MRSRFQNLEPDRQERLIDSAIAEFCAFGYEEGSLNRILQQAGMSKSSFYYYFDDKRDIFAEVARRARVHLLGEIGRLDPDDLSYTGFWGNLEDLLLRAHGALAQDHWAVRIARLQYHLRSGGEPNAASSTLYAELCGWIAQVLANGRDLGLIRLDLPETLLIQMVVGLAEAMDRWLIEQGPVLSVGEQQSLLRREVDLFRRMLEA